MAIAVRRRLTPVPFTKVEVDDVFWAPRIEANRVATIPIAYRHSEETGRIDAWKLDWREGKEPVPHPYWDSDVAKWIEAAAYSLSAHPDPELEGRVDRVVDMIAAAQQPDGYLNVYFTVVAPEKRWANLGMWHELYCAGHLIEAAVAYHEATGKRKLLDVVCRYADHIDSVFGPGKRDGCPGHQEIELALIRLYRATGERRYLELARFFLDRRGSRPSFFLREMEALDFEDGRMNRHFFGADVAAETGDAALLAACKRLWKSVCGRRMYVTGGIGASSANEGFTADHDLPNASAYAETCAAIGLVFWNHRLLQLDCDGRYADVMERALYNGALSGVSLEGESFFYENPLESRGDVHRQPWFAVSCCPPNIARLLASFGQYVYSESRSQACVHLYVQGRGELDLGGRKVVLEQKTGYPWKEKVAITVRPQGAAEFTLALRIPGWCSGARAKLEGRSLRLAPLMRKGYARIRRRWNPGDRIELTLPMPVERVEANPAVAADAGRVALQRGPLVYCLEEVDNGANLNDLILPRNAKLGAKFERRLLGGAMVVRARARRADRAAWRDALYHFVGSKTKPSTLTAVPYCVWDNRRLVRSWDGQQRREYWHPGPRGARPQPRGESGLECPRRKQAGRPEPAAPGPVEPSRCRTSAIVTTWRRVHCRRRARGIL
jgi:DUF1680 family protein